MPERDLLDDADRQLRICNACRYCEGYCAVFPAMERRRSFADADLIYLANLCFECRACYYACPYTAPHEFDVNVPKVLAKLRLQTYRRYTWPRASKRGSMGLVGRGRLRGGGAAPRARVCRTDDTVLDTPRSGRVL